MKLLAHDDVNTIVVLYNTDHEPPHKATREVAALIRRGLIVREIIDADAAASLWGKSVPEKRMREIAKAPVYDDNDGAALELAAKVMRA